MGEHLTYCVDVGSVAEEQGSVGVTEAVEGYVFVYACAFEPFFEVGVNFSSGESFEDYSRAWFSTKFKGLFTDWEGRLGFCLFCLDANAFASIGVVLDHIPVKLEDVAHS